MPSRGRSAPRAGSEQVAAAVALTGSERAAARLLGIARSTINGILRGVHGAGRKTTQAIETLPAERRSEVTRTAQSISAGRGPEDVVARGRELARSERREQGTTIRETEAHEGRMAAQGLDLTGADIARDPRHRDQGVAPGAGGLQERVDQFAPPGTWEELEALWAAGDLTDEFYEAAVTSMTASGSGGTGVAIADL